MAGIYPDVNYEIKINFFLPQMYLQGKGQHGN